MYTLRINEFFFVIIIPKSKFLVPNLFDLLCFLYFFNQNVALIE